MRRALKNYIISYSYSRPLENKEYLDLLIALTSLGVWEFHDASCATQLLQTSSSANELYEDLIDYFDRNDKLLIAEIGLPAWYNLQPEEFARRELRRPASRPPRLSSTSSTNSNEVD